MINTDSSTAVKILALRFILENIDYCKRCIFLQEIISLSKENDIWRHALTSFFKAPLNNLSTKAFSQN